jgi:dimethylamine monooxygenase subunit A
MPQATMLLPFLDGPRQLAMGLNALEPGDWLWPDDDPARYAAEIAQREDLIGTRLEDVHAVLPGAEAAARETLGLVAAWFAEHRPARFAREEEEEEGSPALLDLAGGRRVALDDPLPLRAAGRLAQEDLCLLAPGPDGAYVLVAAILCFPAHWRLREKLGRPMLAIHAPVPGFAERLGATTARFFAGLDPARPVWRANWSLAERPDLFAPEGRAGPPPDLSAGDAGERLWLRVERQTLRRLPASGAVLFTIRTLVRTVAEAVAGEPEAAAALAARLRGMDPALAAYKGVPRVAPALLAWLDRRAGAAPRHA